MEALCRLALPEDVEVAAGAELGEEAGALGRVDVGVKRGEEGVVEHFENFAFGPCPSLLVAAGEFLLVHDFGGEEAAFGSLELDEVNGADVAAAEALDESEVGEG